jgi:translation initiation factor IF-3
VISDEGTNYGVIPLTEALRIAKEANLDLIEISPNAVPPVAKIMDYGKFQYDEKKKQKLSKARTQTSELNHLTTPLCVSRDTKPYLLVYVHGCFVK